MDSFEAQFMAYYNYSHHQQSEHVYIATISLSFITEYNSLDTSSGCGSAPSSFRYCLIIRHEILDVISFN